jgi:hypothetical protein
MKVWKRDKRLLIKGNENRRKNNWDEKAEENSQKEDNAQ